MGKEPRAWLAQFAFLTVCCACIVSSSISLASYPLVTCFFKKYGVRWTRSDSRLDVGGSGILYICTLDARGGDLLVWIREEGGLRVEG